MPHEQITPRQAPKPTPRTPADTGWFADYSEVVTFGGILHAIDSLSSAQDVLYYFEKPWKWTPEYEAWTQHGRPTEPGAHDWDGFVDEASLAGEG